MELQSIFYGCGATLFIYVAYMYTKILNKVSESYSICRETMYINFDEHDYSSLTSGGTVHVIERKSGRLIKIKLRDIGIDCMIKTVGSHQHDNYKIIEN